MGYMGGSWTDSRLTYLFQRFVIDETGGILWYLELTLLDLFTELPAGVLTTYPNRILPSSEGIKSIVVQRGASLTWCSVGASSKPRRAACLGKVLENGSNGYFNRMLGRADLCTIGCNVGFYASSQR
jgi:hypothetical protein